jgi:hypothetical protein
MLEEKNDNLQEADGNVDNNSHDFAANESHEIQIDGQEIGVEVNSDLEDSQPQTELTDHIVNASDNAVESEISEVTEESPEISIEIETISETPTLEQEAETTAIEDVEIVEPFESVKVEEDLVKIEETAGVDNNELTNTQLEELTTSISKDEQIAIDAIEEINAEENEDESIKERHDIPMKEYESLSMEELVKELEELVGVEKLMSVKDHVEEIKKSFLSKHYHYIDEKKEEFLAENPETTEEFHYHSPVKVKFDHLYTQYRDKKNNYFQNLQNNLKTNLSNRLAIVEELKNLIHSQENMPTTLKKFNDIRDRWKVAGPIPKDKYNHVWNNYHFHLENFYDVLHLDREIRDLDFKHNLVQKLKIIERVEELVKEENINKAFRELQDLHKIWKEDIGPVSREKREEIWIRFSELTKQMHDKRESLFEKLREVETANLSIKKEIVSQIEIVATEKVYSHAAWLGQIEKIEALRNQFFSAGKVPTELNEKTWRDFKNAVRSFNVLKNAFYKDIKKDQNDNLSKKQALVAKAIELKDSLDFASTTPLLKQIQEEWKTIGHVPRKLSEKLWAEFRGACNEYFEKLKEQKSEVNAEEIEAFEKKKSYLETLKSFELIGEHKTDLDTIKLHIETWKSLGKVPFARRHIEGKFNKILDVLFEKLSSSKKDNELERYSNRLENLSGADNLKKLENEKVFIMRKIEEVQNSLFQLENNIQFFGKAKADNPLVKEVMTTIENQKEELSTWKEKLKQIRNISV